MSSWLPASLLSSASRATTSAVTHTTNRPSIEAETDLQTASIRKAKADEFARNQQSDATANMANLLRAEIEKREEALKTAYNNLAILALKHSTLVDREEMLKHGYVVDSDPEARIFKINHIPDTLRTMSVLNTNLRTFQNPDISYLQEKEIEALRGPINFFLDKRPPKQNETGNRVPSEIRNLLPPKSQREDTRDALTEKMDKLHDETIEPLRQKLAKANKDLEDFRSIPEQS